MMFVLFGLIGFPVTLALNTLNTNTSVFVRTSAESGSHHTIGYSTPQTSSTDGRFAEPNF